MSWFKRETSDLKKEIADLKRENIRLTTLNQDMDGQIREGLKRKAFGEAEYADILRRLGEHGQLVEAQNEILRGLLERYPEDFHDPTAVPATGGKNDGLSFTQLVLKYVGKGGK
jgi:hypothetical protein